MQRHLTDSFSNRYSAEVQILRDLRVLRQLEGAIDDPASDPAPSADRMGGRGAFQNRYIARALGLALRDVSRGNVGCP